MGVWVDKGLEMWASMRNLAEYIRATPWNTLVQPIKKAYNSLLGLSCSPLEGIWSACIGFPLVSLWFLWRLENTQILFSCFSLVSQEPGFWFSFIFPCCHGDKIPKMKDGWYNWGKIPFGFWFQRPQFMFIRWQTTTQRGTGKAKLSSWQPRSADERSDPLPPTRLTS